MNAEDVFWFIFGHRPNKSSRVGNVWWERNSGQDYCEEEPARVIATCKDAQIILTTNQVFLLIPSENSGDGSRQKMWDFDENSFVSIAKLIYEYPNYSYVELLSKKDIETDIDFIEGRIRRRQADK